MPYSKDKLLGAVGLATKAGKIVFGTNLCVEEMRKNKGSLLLIPNDVSENTRKKLEKTASFHKIPYAYADIQKRELSHATGKISDISTVLITDNGFVKIIEKLGIEIHKTVTEVLD